MKVSGLHRYAILFTLYVTYFISDTYAFPRLQQQIVLDDQPEISASQARANIDNPTSPVFAPIQAQNRISMRINSPTRLSAAVKILNGSAIRHSLRKVYLQLVMIAEDTIGFDIN